MLYSSYTEITDNIIETDFDKLIYGCDCDNSKFEVRYDGIAYPCIAFNGTTIQCENVFEKGLQNVWDNDQSLNLLRNYKNKNIICNKCNLYLFCNGGCPAINYKEHKDIINFKDSRCLK